MTSAKTSVSQFTLNLSLRLVADYDATRWRTSDIKFGNSPMNLALNRNFFSMSFYNLPIPQVTEWTSSMVSNSCNIPITNYI